MVGKTGVARLALTTRAPVIPVAQWGAQDLLARYGKLLKPFPRKLVTVVAGPPVVLDDLYDRPQDTKTLREATERVMAAITALLEGSAARAARDPLRHAQAARAGREDVGGDHATSRSCRDGGPVAEDAGPPAARRGAGAGAGARRSRP